MSLAVNQADYFWADLVRQTDWYRDKAGSAVAERYVTPWSHFAGTGQNAWAGAAALPGLA